MFTGDQNRQSMMIRLTMGLKFVYVLQQPFETQKHFPNEQIILIIFTTRRHTHLI